MSFTKKSLMCGLLVFMSGHLYAQSVVFFTKPTVDPISGTIGTSLTDQFIVLNTPGHYKFSTASETGIMTFHYKNSPSLNSTPSRTLDVCTYTSTSQQDIKCERKPHPKGKIQFRVVGTQRFIAIRSSSNKPTCNNMVPGTVVHAPCLVIGPEDPQRRDVFVSLQADQDDASTAIVEVQGLPVTLTLSRKLESRLVSLPPPHGEDTFHLNLREIKPTSDICIFKAPPSKIPPISCYDDLFIKKSLDVNFITSQPSVSNYPHLYKAIYITASKKHAGTPSCKASNFPLCIFVSYTDFPGVMR